MTRKFSVNCNFGGAMSPFNVYIGRPEGKHHALHFQNDWLGKERGGEIPPEVMEAVTKLQELAEKNGSLSLEDLCVYALGTEEEQRLMEEEMEDEEDEEDEEDGLIEKQVSKEETTSKKDDS